MSCLLFTYIFLEAKKMQTFIIFVLFSILIYQGFKIRSLERKTLDAFYLVCKKLKEKREICCKKGEK